jgi:hypothetical protein
MSGSTSAAEPFLGYQPAGCWYLVWPSSSVIYEDFCPCQAGCIDERRTGLETVMYGCEYSYAVLSLLAGKSWFTQGTDQSIDSLPGSCSSPAQVCTVPSPLLVDKYNGRLC